MLEIPEIYGEQSSPLSRPRTGTSPCCRLSYEASAALAQPRAAGSVMDGLASFMASFFDSIKSRLGKHSQRLTTSERNIWLSCSLLCAPDAGGKKGKSGPWQRACQWLGGTAAFLSTLSWKSNPSTLCPAIKTQADSAELETADRVSGP